VVAKLAVGGARVRHANEDDVALIALNVLEVLDEEGLRTGEVEERLDRRVAPAPLLELVLDRELLSEVEGPDAE
jgi:hypothetical protein